MTTDFLFTSAHLDFRQKVREFAAREIYPQSRNWDKSKVLPREALHLMGSAGILNILGSRDQGGQELDYVSLGIAIEELARADVSCALIAWLQNTLSHFFPGWGDETLQRIHRGEVVIGLATSEDDAGSDVSAMKTLAVASKDGYILNGKKTHVSLIPGADILAVSCRVDTGSGKNSIGMLRVPTNLPGVEISLMNQMGARAHCLGVVSFSDVRLPREALIGEEGQGKALMYARFNVSRCMSPLAALGAASAVLDATSSFAKEKIVFGKPIAVNQAISFPLVEYYTRVEAARLMAYRALSLNDAGEDASTQAAMAKWLGITTSIDAISDCLPIFGANGYLEEFPVEQRLRDVMSLQFTGGTINIMKILLVKELLGREFTGLRS